MAKPGPAYSGSDPYVFICYAHQDSARVYPEIGWLRAQGINVWYDEGISPGEEWSDELGHAIDGADRVLFFVSPAAVERRHCRDEVHFAKSREIPILAVHLEETRLPVGLELALGSSQAILAYKYDETDRRRKLLDAIGLARSKPRREAEPPRSSHASADGSARTMLTRALATVTRLTRRRSSATPEGPATCDRSISVNSLRIPGHDAAAEAIAIELTEAIRDLLTGYQEIRTLSATREHAPRDAPSYSLGGSIRDGGDDWQWRLRLTRAADGQDVWSEAFDTRKQASPSEQRVVVTRAARFIRSKLVEDHRCQIVQRTSSSKEAVAAYCAALREADRTNQVGDGDAMIWIDLARRAVDLDPRILHAYALIAAGYLHLGSLGQIPIRHAASAAIAAVEEGTAMDSQYPSLIAARADIQRLAELDYAASEANYLRALQIAPLDPDAYRWHAALGDIAIRRGYPERALPHFQRSIRINDSDGDIYHQFARVLMCAGEYRAALEIAELGAELLATGGWRVRITLTKVRAHVLLGEMDAARQALDEGIAAIGRPARRLLVGAMALLGEDRDVVEQYISELDPEVGGLVDLIVFTYAALGDRDKFFEWANHGLDLRGIGLLQYLRTHPMLSEMRTDARWPALIEHLKRTERRGLRA